MLRSISLLFLFLILGELLKYFLNIPIAGNILGMLLIVIALKLKVIKLEWVKPASDKLLQYLVLFFIPYGVGLMAYFNIIQDYWLPVVLAVVLSTILTLYITAWIFQKFGKKESMEAK